MKALFLISLAALAFADEDSPKKGFFKSLIKSAGVSTVGDYVPGVTESRVDGAIKTTQAFRKSAEEITEREEHFIGRAVAAKLLARFEPALDDALNDYVQSVCQAVALSSDRPETFKGYHVQVVQSDELNAVSAPGGFIFLTTGLLKRLKSEDELAAVLGHEIAHVAKKHGLKTIKASRLTKAFQVLGAQAAREFSPSDVSQLVEAFGGAIDDIVNDLVVNGYSRDKEYEADEHGARYAARANYDPKALERFIEGLGAGVKGGGWMKTHPSAKQRLKELAGKDAEPGESAYQASEARDKRFEAAMASL